MTTEQFRQDLEKLCLACISGGMSPEAASGVLMGIAASTAIADAIPLVAFREAATAVYLCTCLELRESIRES
jgi:hypothetical protein